MTKFLTPSEATLQGGSVLPPKYCSLLYRFWTEGAANLLEYRTLIDVSLDPWRQ
jgi:hypothetical protein